MAKQIMMKCYALTGGLATGKSTVGRMFEDLGIPRIDADVLVHQLMEPEKEAWRQIVATFGEEILGLNRQIDKRKLADIVFKDPQERKRLEAILHPKVREVLHQEIERREREGHAKILLEIPLLFEIGWDKEENLDAIIVVTCDEKTLYERAAKKFGLDKKAIQARLAAQLPLVEKVKKATFVIDNSRERTATQKQVEAIYKKI